MLNLSFFFIIAALVFFAAFFYGAALTLFIVAIVKAVRKKSAAVFVVIGAIFLALAITFTAIIIFSQNAPVPAPKNDYPTYVT